MLWEEAHDINDTVISPRHLDQSVIGSLPLCFSNSKSFLLPFQADFVKVAHPDPEFRKAAEKTCIEIGTVVEK